MSILLVLVLVLIAVLVLVFSLGLRLRLCNSVDDIHVCVSFSVGVGVLYY